MKNHERFGYEDAARASELVAHQVSAAGLDPNQIRDGLILGSGLGSFPEKHLDENAATVRFADIYQKSLGLDEPLDSVPGHARQLIIGALKDDPNGGLVIAQSGREHPYEGISTQRSVFWIRVMQLLGVKSLIGSTATGILTPKTLKPPALMVINADQDLGGDNPLIGANHEGFGPRFPHMSDLYPEKTRKIIRKVIKEMEAENIREGVYVRVKGPTYERPEDTYTLRKIVKNIWKEGKKQKGENRFKGKPVGVAGMSTVFEQIAAQHATQSKKNPAFLEGRAAIAVATNYASSLSEKGFMEPVGHEEVKKMAALIEERLGELIKETILGIRCQTFLGDPEK